MRNWIFALMMCLGLPLVGGSLSPALAAPPTLHPGYKVAEKYLKATHGHDWEYAVKMIENRSLENFKRIQKTILLRAPTMSDEEILLRQLGLSKISDLDKYSAAEIFVLRAKANAKALRDPEAYVARVRETLKLVTIGTAIEGSDLVHVLVRVTYETPTRAFSELGLVSLAKEGTVWKITLDAQEPKVTPLKPKTP